MSAISGAVGTALLAGVGWILVYFLNALREDRIKRLQITIDHSAEQLRDFYAPLMALTDQLSSLANVIDSTRKSNELDFTKIDNFFHEQFFLPVHEKIVTILSSKIHLMEGYEIPGSFSAYFEHFSAERAVYMLREQKVNVDNVIVPGYPATFYWDIRKHFKVVLARYEASIREIRLPWLGFWVGFDWIPVDRAKEARRNRSLLLEDESFVQNTTGKSSGTTPTIDDQAGQPELPIGPDSSTASPKHVEAQVKRDAEVI